MFSTFTPNQLYTYVTAAFLVLAVAVFLIDGIRQSVRTLRESYYFLADPDLLPDHHALLRAFARLVLPIVMIQIVLGSSEIWRAMAPKVSREWFDTPITTPGRLIDTVFVGLREVLYPAAYITNTLTLVTALGAIALLAIRTNMRLRVIELLNRAISTWRARRSPKPVAPSTIESI
ncbi:hypothetical protein [Mycobacteroides abscessus]|uniref:hypothetical protein n=1 Tax=Mycobacteroides abscessus TaxID=36809 RepID=UPI000926D33B|nr:hypothetical protein [Mycobacteroides abscessus]SIL07578.1 Uncharacterised protein [Mycobacteroides abscessus subsp. abscessus]SIN09761.1 Uncharacterised protein [Mycobacteroides abscessus subsp. abscessus]SIN20427.1 Uncharacterised protein [Mycobacteroides abscessus subsp. abscessus]